MMEVLRLAGPAAKVRCIMQQIEQHRSGSVFSRSVSSAESRKRAMRRREKARERQARYRQSLEERRAPELRDLAELMLAAYLSTAAADDDTRCITQNFLTRLRAAGFSETEAAKRLRELRKRLKWVDSNA
ncbi:MAG: hypothetical protein K2Y27_16280 [Xanthobacteraceae bacterium]|nr:hypothetical protein [Xanthobacteraceae bacterium]